MPVQPKISIIIPVYNGSDYLGEAIDSALAQDYPDFEVIVVNDGSDDEGKTGQTVLSYGDKIIYLEKVNGGVASALNHGIRNASGDYISWLSHDDVYLPGKLSLQAKAIESNPNTVIFSDWYVGDSSLNIIYANKMPFKARKSIHYAIFNHLINGCDLLIPKQCFEKAGFFNEDLKSTQDYDLWFRMAKHYDFHYTGGYVMASRLHEAQGSRHIPSHQKSRDELHKTFLKESNTEIIRNIKRPSATFFLERYFFLKKEGLFEAAALASKLFEKNWKPNLLSGIIFTFKKSYYNAANKKAVIQLKYMLKMLVFPSNWGTLAKIIKGRLKSKKK